MRFLKLVSMLSFCFAITVGCQKKESKPQKNYHVVAEFQKTKSLARELPTQSAKVPEASKKSVNKQINTQLAAAKSNLPPSWTECLKKFRAELIQGRRFYDGPGDGYHPFARDVNTFVSKAKLYHTDYCRGLMDSGEMFSQSIDRYYSSSDGWALLSLSLETKVQNELVNRQYFSLMEMGSLYDKSIQRKSIAREYRVYPDVECKTSLANIRSTTFDDAESNGVKISEKGFDYINKLEIPPRNITVDRQLMLTAAKVEETTFNNNPPDQFDERVFMGIDVPDLRYQGLRQKDVVELDPLVGDNVTFKYFKMSYVSSSGQTLGGMKYKLSKQSVYNYTIADMEENRKRDCVDEAIWDASQLSVNYSDSTEAKVDLHYQAFENFDLAYDVLTQHPLNFDNYLAYFSFKDITAEGGGDQKTYTVKYSPPSDLQELANPLPTTFSEDLKLYLKETTHLNFSDPGIQALMKTVREKTGSDKTHKTLIKNIQDTVVSALTYDFEALAGDAVTIVRASDSLARGKGVCQHFAALFVGLARGLGLPARIVNGYNFFRSGDGSDEMRAGGHAWVEVLVEGKKWLPLEPQDNSVQHLNAPAYFPISVSYMYEETPGGKSYLEENVNVGKMMRGIVFSSPRAQN